MKDLRCLGSAGSQELSQLLREPPDPPGPVGMDPSGPGPPAIRDKSTLSNLYSEVVSELGTLPSGTGPVYFSVGLDGHDGVYRLESVHTWDMANIHISISLGQRPDLALVFCQWIVRVFALDVTWFRRDNAAGPSKGSQ